tara:strand:+ start:1594 stop:2418 length:825 start_codon:yes stop_codon:yes gene_type:complete
MTDKKVEKRLSISKSRLNWDSFVFPEKIKFVEPDSGFSFTEKGICPHLGGYSEREWERRLQQGIKVDISTIGYENVDGFHEDVRSVQAWKFIRVEESMSGGSIKMPLVRKYENEYRAIDGRTTAITLKELYGDFPVWLIDESEKSSDWNRKVNFRDDVLKKYDYGQITKEDQVLVNEIINLLEEKGEKDLTQQLKHQFQIIEHEKFNLEDSIFFQTCKKAGLRLHPQGDVMVTENGKTTLYPMIDVCDDIRKFDKMISDLMNLVNDNMERKGDK